MKVIIRPHFSVKLQASQYNPIEENGSFEIEIEAENEEKVKKEYLKWQKWMREQNIKSAINGVKELKQARKEAIEAAE